MNDIMIRVYSPGTRKKRENMAIEAEFIYINATYISCIGGIVVQAVINISDRTNRVLNIIKAKYGLRTKSEAIDRMATEYEMEFLEPELRPEYVERIKEIEKEEPIYVGTVKDLRKRYE